MSSYDLASGVTVEVYRPLSAVVTVQPQGTPIAGLDGDDGTDGATILYGSGAPSNSLGRNNDSYIDNVAMVFYGPKSAGAWPAGKSMVGPQGSAVVGGVHAWIA